MLSQILADGSSGVIHTAVAIRHLSTTTSGQTAAQKALQWPGCVHQRGWQDHHILSYANKATSAGMFSAGGGLMFIHFGADVTAPVSVAASFRPGHRF